MAFARTGVNLGSSPLSETTAQCLVKQNVSRVAMQLANNKGEFNLNVIDYYYNAIDNGIQLVDLIVPVNDSTIIYNFCNNIVRHLPSRFIGKVWLKVKNDPGLWTLPINSRVSYLVSLTFACKNLGLYIGVNSDAKNWSSVMGTKDAGSSLLIGFPLWYLGEDFKQDFSDFGSSSFGTWSAPSVKEYFGSASICNVNVEGYQYFEQFSNTLFCNFFEISK